MTFRSHLLAAAALALLGSAAIAAEQPAAQSNSPEADASLYGESVVLPKQAVVCAERITGFMPRFQSAYDAWHNQNAVHIANGSKVIHDKARAGGVDADAGLDKLGEADIERLRKSSLELLTRHCQLILESIAPPATN